MCDEAINQQVVSALVGELSGKRRLSRQDAAHRIALLAHEDAAALVPYADAMIDALDCPEAQTRWEIFDALGELVLIDPALVERAYEGAEASLFDEFSATVRLAAFRYLCRLGASSPERSDMVWQLLDEAVQCFHGDAEYHSMLLALLEFARGNLSEQTADALVTRVSFDAENGQGFIKGYSAQIMANARGGE